VVLPAFLLLALGAQDGRTPSIRAVMHKQYRVTRAPFAVIKKELNAPSPAWEKIDEAARDFTTLAAVLDKNDPKWGDRASWAQFTAAHVRNAGEMQAAAEARDRERLRRAQRTIETACKACHDAHRTPRKE
jgi:hypothetical protein